MNVIVTRALGLVTAVLDALVRWFEPLPQDAELGEWYPRRLDWLP
jgi:hypothetical protein